MKKVLLLLCILAVAAVFAHELHLDAVELQQTDLSEITILSGEEYRCLVSRRIPWMTDALSLSVLGQTLPQDDTGLYYSPAAVGITAQYPKNTRIARTEFQTDEHGNTTCKIIRYDGISRSVSELLITRLPVLDLQLVDPKSERTPIADEGRQLGAVRLFFEDDSGAITVQTEAVTARVRGGSSRQYEKKSYALAFIDENKSIRSAQLLDLPSDTEYGLNSLYEDDSKIRDMLSLRIWSALDTSTRTEPSPANAIRMEYVELLINNAYWGVYGLQQLITPAALSLESSDMLFKINGEFLRYKDVLYVRGAEIVCSPQGSDAAALLQKAFEHIPYTENTSDPILDRNSAINYALLLQITCAVDSDTRNMAACYRADKNAVYMIGWDLDQTFGSVWNGIAPALVGNDSSLAEGDRLAKHEWKLRPFSLLFLQNLDFSKELTERYRMLRRELFSTAALLGEANALYDMLTDCGARTRDAKRWPKSPSSADNSFIETFIAVRMAYLDSLYSTDAAPAA